MADGRACDSRTNDSLTYKKYYIYMNYKDYYEESTQGLISEKELEEYYEDSGITGMEKVLVIGKDVEYGIANFYQHILKFDHQILQQLKQLPYHFLEYHLHTV